MKQRLNNKIALVIGASRGIGAAVAKRFAQEGAQLILVARSIAELEAVDDDVQKFGSSAVLVPFDLTDLPRIDDLAKSIAERFGRLDILIGNAAILGGLTPMTHLTPTLWHKIMTTNLHANWHLLRAMEPLLIRAGDARVVFVTSKVGSTPTPYCGAYGVSKAALETMAKTYALENNHLGLKVNLIDPGFVRTSMADELMPGQDPLALPSPEEITEAFVCLSEFTCPWQGEILKAMDPVFMVHKDKPIF
ncbi:MAG: SDR family NAD(P)-dependent oxidoreductase [Alphaproteobacteria bacterium]|nr:SDR family NAD(P)-dependent oxidoreductase [Alphaproteobacteria bacterium]